MIAERLRDAYHEVGHAIVAFALGLEVAWLRLLPNDRIRAGEVIHQEPEHLLPEEQVALAMAGWSGVQMSGVPQTRKGEFDRDLAQMWNVLFREHPDDDAAQDELEDRGIAKAQKILEEHATAVHALARELEARGQLDGAEVKRHLGLR